MKSPELIILTGLPASGKNTWIKKFLKNHSHVVVELDEIRHEIFGHQFHRNAEPFIIAYAKTMVMLLLKQGKSVIINSTAVTNDIRNQWINLGKQYSATCKIVWIRTSRVHCWKRNCKRPKGYKVPIEAFMRMVNAFQIPNEFDLHDCRVLIV